MVFSYVPGSKVPLFPYSLKILFVNLKISQGWLWSLHIRRITSNLVKVLHVWVSILKLQGFSKTCDSEGNWNYDYCWKLSWHCQKRGSLDKPLVVRTSDQPLVELIELNFMRSRQRSDITTLKCYANVKRRILDRCVCVSVHQLDIFHDISGCQCIVPDGE